MARYNHLYTVAFEVHSDAPGDSVTDQEILSALAERIREIAAAPGMVAEAIGGPDDTIDRCPQSKGPSAT